MALLSLRIVDPAMGSGHFLVSLVDWLSDKVLTAVGDAESMAEGDYTSPLVKLIAELREGIVANAREHNWPIVEDQLDDRHIVRRMVLKRCVHGVDLNPMAVELAKVALWLHSFTVGAPLSFLDHHLRCGNSVLGAWVRPTMDWMQERGALISNRHLAPLANIVREMEKIEGLTDTDIAQVDQSKSLDTYAGTADLYVYFYEQGTKLLRPGGRMGYVVTNKWLKAGYAEKLRRMFAEDVWVEFLADFGHARHLFPDADVFPCVIAVQKPDADAVPEQYDLAVIPRDDVPREGLSAAVHAATYRAERSDLTEEAWVLEPPDVAALLKKIRERGVSLEEYAGASPLYGVKTGFNEAFLIDTATRDQLVGDDPKAADIIKPYLRGQDIGR